MTPLPPISPKFSVVFSESSIVFSCAVWRLLRAYRLENTVFCYRVLGVTSIQAVRHFYSVLFLSLLSNSSLVPISILTERIAVGIRTNSRPTRMPCCSERARSRRQRAPLSADKNYDTRGCVDALRCANVTPHVAQNRSNRSSAIDGRTIHHPGCAASQRFRKRIEECFGWAKVIGGIRKSRFQFVLSMAACNLVRLRNPGMAACRWPSSKGLVYLETGESGQIGQFPARGWEPPCFIRCWPPERHLQSGCFQRPARTSCWNLSHWRHFFGGVGGLGELGTIATSSPGSMRVKGSANCLSTVTCTCSGASR